MFSKGLQDFITYVLTADDDSFSPGGTMVDDVDEEDLEDYYAGMIPHKYWEEFHKVMLEEMEELRKVGADVNHVNLYHALGI